MLGVECCFLLLLQPTAPPRVPVASKLSVLRRRAISVQLRTRGSSGTPPPPPLTAELEWASREGPARRSAAASWGEGQTKRLGLSLGDAGSFGGQGG